MSDGRKDNGGPRPGAGRPRKVVEDATRSVLLELFDEKAERAIVANMIANARRSGVTAAPSAINASTWLWDRKYGKVTQPLEHSGKGGGPILLAPVDYRAGLDALKPEDEQE